MNINKVSIIFYCVVMLMLLAGREVAGEVFPITIHNTNGFENYTLGDIAGQSSWNKPYGQPLEAGVIVNLSGGTDPNHNYRNKVLSFEPRPAGAKSELLLDLDWIGEFDPADGGTPLPRDVCIKWEYDFYQKDLINGGVRSHREGTTSGVVQTAILPQRGGFSVNLRKNDPNADTGTYSLCSYELENWHHLEVYEFQRNTDNPASRAQIKIWIDGVEVTAGFDWYAWYNYYQGHIDYLRFYGVDFKNSVGAYYIDNLRVIQDAPIPPEGIIIYNSDGFEYFNPGNVNGQDIGKWTEDALGKAQIVSTSNSGVHAGRGKVLEFVPRAAGDSNTSNTTLNLNWKGNFAANPLPRDTAIKWQYDFYQEGSVSIGGVRSHQASGSSTMAELKPNSGNFAVNLRKNSQDADVASETVGNYSLSGWHHVEVYQYQPDPVYGKSRIRVWLDGSEVTANNTWYSWSNYAQGDIDQIIFYGIGVGAGQKYYIDNLIVIQDPAPPANECGDWGHLKGDLNKDCSTNLMDIAILASNWLDCSMPGNSGCMDYRPNINIPKE